MQASMMILLQVTKLAEIEESDITLNLQLNQTKNTVML